MTGTMVGRTVVAVDIMNPHPEAAVAAVMDHLATEVNSISFYYLTVILLLISYYLVFLVSYL